MGGRQSNALGKREERVAEPLERRRPCATWVGFTLMLILGMRGDNSAGRYPVKPICPQLDNAFTEDSSTHPSPRMVRRLEYDEREICPG